MRRLLLTVVLVALVAGCGDAPEPDAESLAEDASTALEGHATLRFEMRGGLEKEPMRCDGAVDYARRRVQMKCEFPEGDFEVITIGRDEYSRGLELVSDERDELQERWTKTSSSEESAEAFPDLKELLRDLRRSAISSEQLGKEQVRGVETTRYRVVVDPAKSGLAVDEEKEKTATLELWIDDDDLLRRLRGSQDGPYEVEFFAFGEPVEIEPPPAEQVEELDAAEDAKPCAGGETAPLGQAQVAAALEANGIPVESDETGCFGAADGAVVALTTVEDEAEGPGLGVALCRLRRTGSGDEVREERGEGTIELKLANLSCLLVWGGDDEPDRLRALRKAFAELRRSL